MSKGLEALEDVEKIVSNANLRVIDFVLLGKKYEIIEKELKAFEILKKTLYLELVFEDNNYFIDVSGGGYLLTQEEYDLLKEVLL